MWSSSVTQQYGMIPYLLTTSCSGWQDEEQLRGRGGRSQEQYGRGSSQGRARSEDPYAGPSHGQGPRGGGGGRGGRSSSVPGARVSQADVQQAMTNLFLKIRTNVEPHITADGVTGRPDYGTVGQPVDVYVNHFKIADPPVSQYVYQFDVAIEKQRAPGRARGDPGGPLGLDNSS
ncbi:uncharacterized protein HaLaN_17327 [Haematococcus lacustris]|uniref:Protein argonaute N-terminal domain-containing protein n=1 Tax=Haematococcus lacustris TaxID=44745 RepID=A0A699ZC13_HAELA|nr:uncharacterized protein HaLaN_17327 [Haematococcus lacustris]